MQEERPRSENESTDLADIGRNLLTGGIWAFGGKVVTAGSGILISILVTRLLLPEAVGAYFLALSIVTFAAIAGRFGLEKTILQVVAERLGKGDRTAARPLVVQVLLIALCAVTLLGLVITVGLGRWVASELFSSSALARVGALLAPWMAYLAFEGLVAETFRGLDDIARASIYGGAVSRSLCVLALSGLLALRGGGSLEHVVLLTIASGALGLLAAGLSLDRKLGLRDIGPDSFTDAADLLRVAWPLLISNMTLYVVGNVDLWILGAFRPEQEVALYGVAVRLVLLVGVPLTIANAVLPPIIGKLYARGDRAAMERVIRTTTTVAAVPSVVILTLFTVAGGPILTLAFGSYYRDAAVVLALLGLGQLTNVLVGTCGYVLIMTGHQRQLMWAAVVSGSVSIVGGLLTVSSYGAEGVAASMLAGMATQQILMLALAHRRVGVWTHASPRYLSPAVRFLLDEIEEAR